jgi:hypothetical protein
MFTRKTILAPLVVAALGGLVAPAMAHTSVDIRLGVPPPPLRYEVVPAPRYGYVWVPGYWDTRHHHRHGYRYVWVDGYWQPHRRGYYWSQPRWVERRGYWHYERGRWDRDDDGVPNRYDRYPNNPYRR